MAPPFCDVGNRPADFPRPKINTCRVIITSRDVWSPSLSSYPVSETTIS